MMKKALAVLCGAAGLVASGAITALADPMTDCQQLADKYRADWNAGNAGALADMFDSQTGMFSNMMWTATGHAGLAAGFKQEMGTGEKFSSITCANATRAGDWLVSDGTWAGTGKGPDGKEMSVTGHWMSSGEYHGEKVTVLKAVVNTQMPPPPAPK